MFGMAQYPNAFLKVEPIVKRLSGLSDRFFKYFQHSKSNLLIETISICNVRCIWCQMQNFNKHKLGFMKLEQFAGIIKDNKEFIRETYNAVEPYFRGEPLLHKNIWEIFAILKSNNIKNGGINTNLSVNIDAEKFLEFDCPILVNIGGINREVHESVMRGSSFDLVTTNLQKMFKLKIPLTVKMNPVKTNIHQIKDLPRFIESLGGKKENIMPYTTCYPLPATATAEEIDTFFKEVVSDEVDPYLRFTYDLKRPNKAIKTKKKGCNFLNDTIFFDGQFSICCHDQLQMINLGNVFEKTIKDIRESKEYLYAVEKAKRCEFPFCKECN